ncbi:hypothetical protein GCM10011531_17250 [Aquaticitalea lipolytica]|uniref:Uncharacterized protein n=1 Tax=Aquaticitalea lipolytica TaxID=1247562 RepID=A0A8J2XH34_9FLAO|nr:hypothetical protein [Aquaticitalea lipolytica]GFZ86467.1 hypothetical protein GCM10011531_17250 [Aquaticitalea lipolytica]
MILKAFKKKSNQKYINNILNQRHVAVNSKKIESVGVIFSLDEFGDFDVFRAFLNELNILPPKTKIIAFVDDEKKNTDTLWDTYFTPKDFGWNGKIKNVDLQSFVEKDFDALICFYKQNTIELDLITATSNANFKIGISNKDNRLYDFIIDVNPKNFDVFKTELKKYLTVLNKI